MNLGRHFRRMTLKSRTLCAAVLGSLAVAGAQAEDIDIFAANSLETHAPNILVIIDSSSNWSASLTPSQACITAGFTQGTKFGAEMCALDNVIAGLNSSVRVGLMMFAESGNNGAYMRFGIRDMNLQNRTALRSLLKGLVPSGTGTDNSGSNQPYAKTMFEAYKYFGGYTSQAHANDDIAGTPTSNVAFGNTAFVGGNSNNAGTFRRDYPNNNAPANRAAALYNATDNTDGASDYAYTANNSDTYISPIKDGCAKNFIIFISNGNPSTGGDSSTVPARDTQIMTNLGVTPTCLPNCTNELHASKMDEMAKFMFETDVSSKPGQQNVQTFTVAVYDPQASGLPSNSDQQMINLMQNAANVGGGKSCTAKTAAEVSACINGMFNELQAVNSVFVSSSLPVSVNAQGTFLNQVYMGMFRPDRESSPRWVGNLKEYKVDKDSTGALFLADSVDAAAVNPTTGFISPNAKSFWSATSTFWINQPLGTPKTTTDFPDGEVVEKGGAAEQVRTTYATDQSSRKMFTCQAAGCTANAPLSYAFNTTNLTTASAFGAASATELASIINWVRGQDNVNAAPCAVGSTTCAAWSSAEQGPGWPTTVRPSVHGDVLHSRPVVLNYPNIGPYVFYGANDGVLRAIKGGRAAADGKEQWSFVAPEFFGRLKRLRDEAPVLVLPTVPGSSNARDYFFDGPIGSFQDATRAWIFVAARRGGRFIYAFDVTDPTNPKFMWKKSNTDTNMSELGQTWSEPKAAKVKAFADPVLIFAAGYDPAEDQVPPGTDSMGRGVFVLNARTGQFIKFFQTSANSGPIAKSIPSDVAVIDRDQDTFADKVYVGDTGGNVWRMDIDNVDPNNWKLEKLASLGSGLKFMFRPDVIATKAFDTVLIGTGDREKPLNATNQDYFFMLKDTATGTDGSALVPLGFADLTPAGTSTDPPKGFVLTFRSGEKAVNAPLTIGGITFFATNRPVPPASGTCTISLGEARGYAVDFLGGGAGIDLNGDGLKNTSDVSAVLPGGGLPPSPVGGTLLLDDGTATPFCVGCMPGTPPPDAKRPPVQVPKVRKKVYWNSNTDK
ncbi:MAG TPA: PilC/PilY family type IV pilus protein [Usitatibacter sp.]|nr:PilC/PilY family type IV pilus protein [Usitatibacter sp.]